MSVIGAKFHYIYKALVATVSCDLSVDFLFSVGNENVPPQVWFVDVRCMSSLLMLPLIIHVRILKICEFYQDSVGVFLFPTCKCRCSCIA